MNRIRSFLPSSLLVLGASLSLHAGPNDTAWIQLFDKTDTVLTNDWDIKIAGSALNEDPRETFRWAVSGGDTVIEVNYSNYTTYGNAFGHMGYKHREFSHYLLRGEYQVWGTQMTGNPGSWALENNGFMLHSQSMASMTMNQDFPVSLEAQLLGPANSSAGGATSASTMNLCTPGTGYYTAPTGGNVVTTHCIPAKPTERAPANTGWQKVSALILGDSLHQYYAGPNGTDSVLRYYRPVYLSGNVSNPPAGLPANGTPLTSGYIVIQSESHPFRFRKIEVVDLVGCMTPNDVNYNLPGQARRGGLRRHRGHPRGQPPRGPSRGARDLRGRLDPGRRNGPGDGGALRCPGRPPRVACGPGSLPVDPGGAERPTHAAREHDARRLHGDGAAPALTIPTKNVPANTTGEPLEVAPLGRVVDFPRSGRDGSVKNEPLLSAFIAFQAGCDVALTKLRVAFHPKPG